MTIGKITKQIGCKLSRHAQILIGYIACTPFQGITNKAARRCTQANLFHTCMEKVLAPITPLSETGITMMSADWVWHHCHPIFSVFVGDYPEQAL